MRADIFFDTNILIYAHLDQGVKKRDIARDYLESGMRYGIGVISTQVLGEFVVNVTRKAVPAMSLKQVHDEVEDLAGGMRIVDIGFDLVKRALNIVQDHHLSYWDALIIASAEKAKCQTLLTEDLTHGRKYGRLKIVNPFI